MPGWENSHHASFTLWDIDREFQNANEAYEQCLTRDRRKRTPWKCFGVQNQDDRLAKALSLGRQVEEVIKSGQETFGATFEKGDSKCHGILTAQLHRIQHEIVVPLIDCAYSRIPISIPYDDIITTARGVRRSCLSALRDLHERLLSPSPTLLLPPPRFSVQFCPFALQLQKESSSSRKSLAPNFLAKKVRPHDRHDEREICPHCSAHISVATHSGLPVARRHLFQAHIECTSKNTKDKTSYACSSCYKTFDDAYSYLDHIFQKQIGSERSCQKRWNSAWNLNQAFMESDPALVEKCLKNCLNRELVRIRAEKTLKRPNILDTRCDSAIGMQL